MPNESYVYLGDTARVPYGNKSAETVQLYSQQCATFLNRHNVKLIVVACNTASALALDDLQQQFDIPIVGMIDPAARQAVASTRNGSIGVIGTRATIGSEAYQRSISKVTSATNVHVHSVACPLFVPLVEEGWLDTPATRLVAETYIQPLLQHNIDTLVLGCTHYPMLEPVLSSILPSVTLIDCGSCAAIEAQRLVAQSDPSAGTPKISIFVTDTNPAFSSLATRFLGFRVETPTRVSIDGSSDHEGQS